MNKTKDWKYEIRILGNDFCICRNVVEQIISNTESHFIGESQEYLYNKAWSALKPLF